MPAIHVKYKKDELRNVNIRLFTVLTLLVSTTASQGVPSKCDIPSVPEGQQTTLTCHFSEDLSQLNRKFKVVHYFAESEKPENVLLCYWSSGIAHCQAHRDYTVIGNVTDKVTLKVRRASRSHTGRYLCHAFQSTPESDESCNFSLKKVKSSCDIPVVVEGGNATLSCQFDNDLSKLQMRVKVVHYKNGRTENVLLCAWSGGKPICQTKDGYTFGNIVTDSLLLEIPLVSPHHAGAYRCQLYQSVDGTDEFCHFIVTEHSGDLWALDSIDEQLIPLLTQLVLFILVAMAIFWIQRQGLNKPKHPMKTKYDMSDLQPSSKSLINASDLNTSPESKDDTFDGLKTSLESINDKANDPITASESINATRDIKASIDQTARDLTENKYLDNKSGSLDVGESKETTSNTEFVSNIKRSPRKIEEWDRIESQQRKKRKSRQNAEVSQNEGLKKFVDDAISKDLAKRRANYGIQRGPIATLKVK